MRLKVNHPIFYRPEGCIASLWDLTEADGVLERKDMTDAVCGKRSRQHQLAVVALAGGKVMGELSLALTRNNLAIGEVQSLVGDWSPDHHPQMRRRRFRLPQRRRGTALLLATREARNYYHWLLDSLPRWRLIEAAGFSEYDHVLLNAPSYRFCEESLDRLAVPRSKRMHCSTVHLYEFERLVVPAMPFPRWEVAGWACRWVRSLFAEPAAGGPERIYVSRRAAKLRRLVNEPELESRLADSGFVTVQTEHHSVADQAKLFSRAKWIVVPHGSALANLVFAPAGARVIELLPPQWRNPPVGQQIAAACGFEYFSITGEVVSNSAYKVDLEVILRTLGN